MPRGDLNKLFAVSCDPSNDRETRTRAADAICLVGAEIGLDDHRQNLVQAVLSRVLDDGPSSAIAEVERLRWRAFDCAGLAEAAAAGSLSREAAKMSAGLLFEAGRHDEASQFFEFALRTKVDAETLILAAYNREVLARERRSASIATDAIKLLADNASTYDQSPELLVEVDHVIGHLYLIKGRFEDTRALGYERKGVSHLRKAARGDPAYCACYASSFAEYGDYLATVECSLDLLAKRPYSTLATKDATLVHLELLFYLGYSLLAIGELERAEFCFKGFLDACDALDLEEAIEHAKLFLFKIDMRRSTLLELPRPKLREAARHLRALTFREGLSAPVVAETKRYEAAIEFLDALKVLRESPSFDDGASMHARSRAQDLCALLAGYRPEIFSDQRVIIRINDADAGIPGDLAARLKSALPTALKEVPVLDTPDTSQKYQTVSIHVVRERPQTDERLTVLMDGDIRLSYPASSHEITDAAVLALASAVSLRLALIGLSRFVADDMYVFGIVPCSESPATKYQRMRFTLDFVEQELERI